MTFDLVVCSNGSLIIQEVDFSDAGFYTCVADNGGGGVSQVSVAVDVGLDLLDTGTLLYWILSPSLTVLSPEVHWLGLYSLYCPYRSTGWAYTHKLSSNIQTAATRGQPHATLLC